MSGKDIVCKFCAHGKHWHTGPNQSCRAPEGPGFDCDCPVWVYGKNIADVEIGDDDGE